MHYLQSGLNCLGVDEATGLVALLTCGEHAFIQPPVPSARRGLLRLHLPLPDFEAHMVDVAHTAPQIRPLNGGEGLVLAYPELVGKRGLLPIAVEIALTSAGDGGFALEATIANRSPYPIPQIFFPVIAGLSPVDGLTDPQPSAGHQPPVGQVTFGRSVFKPWQSWGALRDYKLPRMMRAVAGPEYEVMYPRPYECGMKWMDFGGQERGLALYSEDTSARVQYLHVSALSYAPETVDLAWYFYPFLAPATATAPGAVWRSPKFVLYPHTGDWRMGVLKYKTFADHAFTPVPSTPDRDLTLGQQTLWMSWHYQDWQDLRYTFKDIPAIAAEARQAGFREMTLSRATALDFCLPHVVRRPLGDDAELKEAVAGARQAGVNVILFSTSRLVRPDTIPQGEDAEEWFRQNIAGQKVGDNWTYDPQMTPHMPVRQIGSRAAYYTCAGSQGWQQAFRSFVRQMAETWDMHGLMFDQSCSVRDGMNFNGLCFNPLHAHRPDEEGQYLADILFETRRWLAEQFPDAVVAGEGQWDHTTQWMDYTWEWLTFDEEEIAPFHMAFPRARTCIKCSHQRSLINRIFTAGYWLEFYLEDGMGRLADYPELAAYLRSLADFKAHFLPLFSRRDFYLYNLHTQVTNMSTGDPENAWVRVHRSGQEALILVTHKQGKETRLDLEVDLAAILGPGHHRVTVWSRTLQPLASSIASNQMALTVEVPAEDFIGIHIQQ
ncbi:MAG: hypothetical protein HY326_05000 [Chloroflexi bacterium]|nr:hypothetical protein [Chloroflexota bacterium]